MFFCRVFHESGSFRYSRVEPGRVRKCSKSLTGRVASDRKMFRSHGSGRVESGRAILSRFDPREERPDPLKPVFFAASF